MITKDNPGNVAIAGEFHAQALALISSSVGAAEDLEKLQRIFRQASGNEAELISWLIEGWMIEHGEATLTSGGDLDWVDALP